MKKISVFFIALILPWLSYSQNNSTWQVTPQQALIKAKSFFAEKGMSTKIQKVQVKPHINNEHNADSIAPYYIFNAGNKRGFVIISGDSRVEDVLGYSDMGDFNVDSIPDNMREWLKGYKDAIEVIKKNNVHTIYTSTLSTLKPAIAPIVKTQWSQSRPYNNQAPQYNGTHCLTGCVATAMAQVMNHARWPQSSTSAIPSYTTNVQVGELTGLPPTTFDWDIIAIGTGTAYEEEVAKLMRYCGQSVKMNYGTGQSSAFSNNVAPAFADYFGYSNAKWINRESYSVAEWDEMIYNELVYDRAVYYGGQSLGGGHAFVVDGYDGNGLFHINWGWGGYCDGYFKLSVLNPYSNSGYGASSSNDGYSMDQSAIIGLGGGNNILEDKIQCRSLLSYQALLYCDYYNESNRSFTCSYGFAIMDDEGNLNLIGAPFNASFTPGQTITLSIDLAANLTTIGTYTIVPVFRKNSNEPWKRTADYKKYATVTVSSNHSYNITIHPIKQLSLEGLTIEGNQKLGSEQVLKFSVKNSGDDYSGTVYCFISSTTDKGNSISRAGMAIEGGTTETVDIYLTPPEAGLLNVWLSTDYGGDDLIGVTTITITSDQTEVSSLSLTYTNVETLSGSAKTTFRLHNDGNNMYGRPIYVELTDALTNEVERVYTMNGVHIAPGGTGGWWIRFVGLDNSKIYHFNIYYYAEACGAEKKLAGTVEIVMPEASVRPKHNLSISVSAGGSVLYSGVNISGATRYYEVIDGSIINLSLSEYEGYRLKVLEVNGNDVTLDVVGGHYSISNVKTDQIVKVVFVHLPTLTIKQSERGTVKIVLDNERTRTFVFCPINGKRLLSLIFNGEDVTKQLTADYKYTTPIITDDSMMEIVFGYDTYKLIYQIDGVVYKTYEIEYGKTITAEPIPTKEGYTFSGWSDIPATMPDHDVTVTGSFTVNQYNLTYIVNEQQYKSLTLNYGEKITPEANPEKEGYAFSGWSEIPATMPAHDVTVTGSFTVNKYKLTYMVDGQIYKATEVDYGTTITPEPAPKKEGYTFSGWSEIPATMPAHDVTVTGTFTVNKYQLTYIVDGEEYKTYEVEYGTIITPEPEPTKEGFVFSGWNGLPETMPAHVVIVTGTFSKAKYMLTYMVDGEVYKSQEMDYGAAITPEPAPTKEGHTFSGWSEIPATMPAHDVTVTGSFSVNKYILTYILDGKEYKTMEVEYGTAITPEPDPEKEGYTFSGWSEIPETMPARIVIITGSFSINNYTLTYMIDEEVYKQVVYEYGATITPEPQPEGDYISFEWVGVPEKMPAHDVTVTAVYETGIAEIIMMAQQGQVRIYAPNGKRLKKPQKGLNIVVMQDGTTRKVVVR